MRARQPSDQIAQGLSQPLCNEPTSSKSTSQHAEMFGFLFYFLSLFLFFCCFSDNHDAIWHALVAVGPYLLFSP